VLPIVKKLHEIEIMLDENKLATEGARYMQSITPIRSGNAKRHTSANGNMIQADYLIDDHEKNLHTFTGTPLLFTAPHNLHINDFKRVNNWKEVEKLLLD
jgi:hypothetical protein